LYFTQGYKECVHRARARHGISIATATRILSIPEDTLKKFSRSSATGTEAPTGANTPPKELPAEVIELANAYLRSGKGQKSVKGFCRRHPELLTQLGLTYRQALEWLRELGLVSPRGIFLKNTGLDRILRFKPNQVWASDGKLLTVILNGEIFQSTWQCLVDCKTTAIVGGVVRDEENTKNLVDALETAEDQTGIRPMALVLDNRLSENLPAVRPYFEERGIEIVKTFPGNSKSNAMAEENFNVFDLWVGAVKIDGKTPAELARSITQALVEVFTQMRGHKPRKGLSMKTATEAMNEAVPATPEEEAAVREKLKALAERLKREQATPVVTEQKKAAIAQAILRTNPPHVDIFTKQLQNARFTPALILTAIAILETRRKQEPEKKFGHAYFGGILRRLADQETIEHLNTNLNAVYAHHWDTMGSLTRSDLALSLKTHPEATCARLVADFLHMPIPAFASRILLDLKDAFIGASRGSRDRAEALRGSLAEAILQSRRSPHGRREVLLRKLYEWENFVRMADAAVIGPSVSPPFANA
jgi:transposase InsO family protein